MSEIKLFKAPLDMEFESDKDGSERFKREFDSILPGEEDALGAWLKRAKSRGETKESDQVLLTLLIELHRKVDALSDYIKNEHKQYLPLKERTSIEEIGFTHIKISEEKFIKDEIYYARIAMPIFPKRNLSLYLRAVSENLAKIENMHEEDEADWNAYVTARERVMIREMYIFLGFGIVLAIIVALMLIKDSETNKKFARFERAIESVMQENFNLKKQISMLEGEAFKNSEQYEPLKKQIKENIDLQINEKIVPIIRAIKSIERVIDDFATEQKDRIVSLEERTRDINKIAPSVINEEEQILKMFKDGKSAAMIAKDLHVGMGRVEFVLKFHKLA